MEEEGGERKKGFYVSGIETLVWRPPFPYPYTLYVPSLFRKILELPKSYFDRENVHTYVFSTREMKGGIGRKISANVKERS